eukprot:1506953-Prymnesium_polylepis.3
MNIAARACAYERRTCRRRRLAGTGCLHTSEPAPSLRVRSASRRGRRHVCINVYGGICTSILRTGARGTCLYVWACVGVMIVDCARASVSGRVWRLHAHQTARSLPPDCTVSYPRSYPLSYPRSFHPMRAPMHAALQASRVVAPATGDPLGESISVAPCPSHHCDAATTNDRTRHAAWFRRQISAKAMGVGSRPVPNAAHACSNRARGAHAALQQQAARSCSNARTGARSSSSEARLRRTQLRP